MKKTIKFNKHGYIESPQILELELNDFIANFVFNARRKRLFDAYIFFIERLKSFQITNFYQWLDGSFTTNKLYPNDIDFVTFLDFEVYEK